MVLSEMRLDSPSLDIGCGDGANSYILTGGNFTQDFDDFVSIRPTLASEFLAGATDTYDAMPTEMLSVDHPPIRIDVGLDRKESLLRKAKRLGLYRGLVRHDLNEPLPFPANYFRTAFSNILYWIDRF